MTNSFWVTPADGVVSDCGNGTFSNHDFIREIKEYSDNPMGILMLSQYMVETTISFGDGGTIPPTWQKLEKEKLSTKKIESLIDTIFTEPDVVQRVTLSRGEISDRINDIAPHAGFKVTKRGIKPNNDIGSVYDLLREVIYSVYFFIEKNTTASMKIKDKKMSKDKRDRLQEIYDILSVRGEVTDVFLINPYVEPAPSIMRKLFCLGTLYGMDYINTIVSHIYYKKFSAQAEVVRGMEDYLK